MERLLCASPGLQQTSSSPAKAKAAERDEAVTQVELLRSLLCLFLAAWLFLLSPCLGLVYVARGLK